MEREEIVVGLDGTPSARAALRWAAAQAKLTGCRLRALNIFEWPYLVSADGELVWDARGPGNPPEDHRRQLQATFDSVSPCDDWRLELFQGHPGKVLAHQAEDARLLVVGTGEHVGLGRVLLGSTSHYCLSHARCPVVCVPVVPAVTARHDADAERLARRS